MVNKNSNELKLLEWFLSERRSTIGCEYCNKAKGTCFNKVSIKECAQRSIGNIMKEIMNES